MIDEFNPNHPVTKAVHDQWHKIAALLLYEKGFRRWVIPEKLVRQLSDEPGGLNITIRFIDGVGIELRLVTDTEAERLAEQEGGLPA
jgi:hypothetical protein